MDKIKILFLAANPGGSQLQLDREAREITAKIRAAEHRDSLELITRWAVRPDDLQQALLETKPHVLHFSGHGSRSEEIVLVDDRGGEKPVSKQALQHLLSVLRDNLRLVVLNACYSKPQAEAITKCVDCALGMNQAIGDEAAILFAGSFYRALGFGRSVHEAFELGRNALLLDGITEENTPELICREGVDSSTLRLIQTKTDPPEGPPPPSDTTPLIDFLFADDARLNHYSEQIAAPVTYAEATQSGVTRSLTRLEKLTQVIERLKKQKQLIVVRTQSDRRVAPRDSFLLETCTAVKIRIPRSGADEPSISLWVADPLEREDVDTRQTCTLCLLQDFSKADNADFPDESLFSVLDVILSDLGAPTNRNTRHGLMSLASDGSSHIEFGRHPEAVLRKLGASVSRPRVITVLYRERFIGHETDLDDEGEIGEFPYSAHAILYGYAIAIVSGRVSLQDVRHDKSSSSIEP
jgi:hypothetical protein